MMTKELHDKLTKYESIFNTAIKSKYYRAMDSRFAADFVSGCKEMNIYINVSCPTCVLKALQTLGQLYFDYQEPEPTNSIQDTEKPKDNKTTTKGKTVSQNANKQEKKKK